MKHHLRFLKNPPKRGSALLIVLGFLSFMMISAVSFCVYMRIERQASSNYRHSTTARHLLNAGLFRAIDEIDSELRIPKINGVDRPRKFPDWPGRVKTSAVHGSSENSQNARVLSLESLSFLPALFVNDLRRYAIPNEADGNRPWLGAKWRNLSLPVISLGGHNADGQAVIGRYAYVCVNVSDLLDANVCKAATRDATTNRVGIGHLFTSDGQRTAFDKNYADTDKHYETLQDFYACMFGRNDTVFGSPYHDYLDTGTDGDFKTALKHVLVTDSIVKAQPAAEGACNLKINQPIAAGVLSQKNVPNVTFQATFGDAMQKAFAGRLPASAVADGPVMATMVADYIDKDSIPKRINLPTVEMVPMISQIVLAPNTLFAPTITARSEGDPSDPTMIYSLSLVKDLGNSPMAVEVVWPFKNHKDRANKPTFKVEVEAYLKVIKPHAVKSSNNLPGTKALYDVTLTGTIAVPSFWATDTSSPDNCYRKAQVMLTASKPLTPIDIMNSKSGGLNGYTEGQEISVAVVVFATIKQGSDVVDRAPVMANNYPPTDISPDEDFMVVNKLYFQTKQSPPLARIMAVPFEMSYRWGSLEVPDPRFNHKASNWVKNSTDRNLLNGTPNPSTTALLGQDGRDGDIYMFASDQGELYSPGEMGFVVRPFPDKQVPIQGAPVDFDTHTVGDGKDESEYMFRTVRLYDHGEPANDNDPKRARDPVYDYFIAQNPDGTVSGARVNPCSDLPLVLAAAVENTPLDYWYANQGDPTLFMNNTFTKSMGQADWVKFVAGWSSCLTNARTDVNTTWKRSLSDVYGEWNKFGWYSENNPNRIFDTDNQVKLPGVLPVSLANPLYEIDRKMLMSYTLDSFSDRQQLFLYVLRAEATVPTFGGNSAGGARSLAGGRAVALVWRDPYPFDYSFTINNNTKTDQYTKNDAHKWYNQINRISPWYQHNLNKADDSYEAWDDDPLLSGGNRRTDGFHRHRILYFKQLDQ